MTNEPRESRKRSRYDDREPETRVRSRYHRERSRSPARERRPDNRRERSPQPRRDVTAFKDVHRRDSSSSKDSPRPTSSSGPSVEDAKSRVLQIAKKIAAEAEARKASLPVNEPKLSSAQSVHVAVQKTTKTVDSDVYTEAGDYIKDIEINDLRNRYTLTKGSFQKMIKETTGADVTTRGEYKPDKTMATPTNPPLHLHVTHRTKEGLEAAVAKIEEQMTQELPNLVDERRFRRPREAEPVERDHLGRRKWPEEKIPINLELIPGFNLRAQVVGHQGVNVKHIQQEANCKIQIKGRGSGFIEHDTGQESDEPMYLHVSGSTVEKVEKAKGLCLSLLESVKQQYNEFKEKGHTRGFRGHDHDRDGRPTSRGRHEGRHNRDRRHDRNEPRDQYANGNGYGGYGYGYQGYGSQQSASMMAPTSQAPEMPAGTDLNNFDWAAYASSCVTQWGYDPYAEYGGAESYLRYYYTMAPYGYSDSTVGQDHTNPSTYSGVAVPPGAYPSAGTAPPPPPPPPPPAPTDEALPPPPPENFPPPPPPGL